MPQTVSIQTLRGNSVQCILSSCQSPKGIVITAAGAGGGPGPGGSDGPYYLYQKLARKLPPTHSISVLQIIYHLFSDMQAAVDDILAAIDYATATMGSTNIVLIGWSMGGAAVVEAAYQRGDKVQGIITIGGQTVGGENAIKLHPETAFTILHGMNDTCITPAAANHFYNIAGGNSKRNLTLNIFPGEDHGIQGAWDFLMSGSNAHLRHLFCVSEEAWRDEYDRQAHEEESSQQNPNDSEFYILRDGQLLPVHCKDFIHTKISDIKQWFASNYGIPSESQEYIFNGDKLQNQLTLAEAGIKVKSTIRLQVNCP